MTGSRHVAMATIVLVSCAAHARAAADEPPDPAGALLEEAAQTAGAIRELIVLGVAGGRHENIFIEFGASVTQGTLASADERGIGVATRTATISVPWKRVKPRRLYFIGKSYVPADDAFLRLLLGRYCVAHGLDKEARDELGRAASLDASLEEQVTSSLAIITEREARRRAVARPKASAPEKKRLRLPVTGRTAEVLAKLGRSHFMIGVTQSTHASWIKETREQGCRWDMRYQYLAGGINTRLSWRKVNRPDERYALNYLKISDAQGVVPVITWYEMRQSMPGGQMKGEAQANETNCKNVETMRTYLGDVKFFMEVVATKFGKPVIFHVEPDLTGFFLTWNQYRKLGPDGITVMVKSTGIAEVQDYPDTLTGFFQAIIHLRDTYAPNVLLAYHASLWGRPPPLKRIADLINSGGGAGWDLIFTDPSDRDAAWKIANKYALHDTWWDDKRFEEWRTWSGEIHRMTGLPLMAWQIPTGNTIMAACNNTAGHYMDNRPQYWLEDYPKNTHLLEWAQAGYIGLLFGRGAGGNTHFGDAQKDGVTNPEPIEGNRGETSSFPDDDGGYLRIRGAQYYRSPLLFDVRPSKKQARR